MSTARKHNIRTLQELKQIKDNFQCTHCHRVFKTENGYLQHECKEMRRRQEIKTPIGQNAWSYYQHWFKVQRKQIPSIETFLTSPSYAAFIRFANFAKDVCLPTPEKYIQKVTTEKFPPPMWTRNELYKDYLHYLDSHTTPQDRAKVMVKLLDTLAEEYNCTICEVFNRINANDVLLFIKRREFTPWILLRSKCFGKLYNRSTAEQKTLLNSLMVAKRWRKVFDDNPEIVTWMDKLISGMDL